MNLKDLVLIKDNAVSELEHRIGDIGIITGRTATGNWFVEFEGHYFRYIAYESELIPIPEEIKDWPIEEIRLYLAL